MLYFIPVTSLLVWSNTQQICHKRVSLRQSMTVIKPIFFHHETKPQPTMPVLDGTAPWQESWSSSFLLAELTVAPTVLSPCSQGTKLTTFWARPASIQLNTTEGSRLFIITSKPERLAMKWSETLSWLLFLPSACSSVPFASIAHQVSLRPLYWISGSCLYHIHTMPQFGLHSSPRATERGWRVPKSIFFFKHY